MARPRAQRQRTPASAEDRYVVLHVADRESGGVPVAMRTYIENSPAGISHVVLAPPTGRGSSGWSTANVDSVHPLPAGHLARIREVRRVTALVEPDVVHAHSSFSGVYVRVALSRRRRRIVYTPHCFAFERRDIGPFSRAAYRFAEWMLARNTTLVAACSLGEQRIARALGPRRMRTVLIPNVASIDVVTRPEPAARADLRIATVGRISPQKDPAEFVKVVETIRGRGRAVTPTWVGDDDSDRSAAVAALREADVEITGWLARDAVADSLRRSDLYVHTALWEGFPLAVLDAHAAGLPVLVRSISAFAGIPPELTLEHGLGALIEALDADARAGTDEDGDADATAPGGGPGTAFAAWAAQNRAFLDGYLAANTVPHQRASLESAWRG